MWQHKEMKKLEDSLDLSDIVRKGRKVYSKDFNIFYENEMKKIGKYRAKQTSIQEKKEMNRKH